MERLLSLFGFYRGSKMLLAFEYGLHTALLAQEHKIELTPDHVLRAEKMLENEAKHQTDTFMATNMVPLILTIFEVDITK